MFDIYNASNQTVGMMTNFECPPHKVTTAEKAGELTAYVIVFVMSFMGNNLIIYMLFKSKNLKRNINLLVLNVAISDLFTSVFMIPRRVVQIALELPSAKWILSGVTGEITCKLQTFMHDFSGVVSTGFDIPRKTSGRRISPPRQNGHIQVTGDYNHFVLVGQRSHSCSILLHLQTI